MESKRVIAGTIVGAEDGNIGEIVTTIGVHAALERPVRTQCPISIESVLNAGGGVNRIRRMVVRVDDGRPRDAAAGGDIGVVDGLESGDPSILREVVIVHSEAASQNAVAR